MSSSDSHDDPSPDSGPAFSREALTPRGGFMARPGLKPPPRHAVVVRGGDAPVTEAIPVARSSFPPPAPSEPPPPPSASEKATLRAIPTARVPRISNVVFDEAIASPRTSEPAPPQVPLESVPPPSDAPVAHSIPPVSIGARPRRKNSGWAIFAAGAAGLVLGLASVLATRGGDESASAAAAPAPVVEPRPVLVTSPSPVPAVSPSSATTQASASKAAAAPPGRPAAATVKKSIF